jgi:hypothetical protein
MHAISAVTSAYNSLNLVRIFRHKLSVGSLTYSSPPFPNYYTFHNIRNSQLCAFKSERCALSSLYWMFQLQTLIDISNRLNSARSYSFQRNSFRKRK